MQKSCFRLMSLVLFLTQIWKLKQKNLEKTGFLYMIWPLRVVLTYTIAFYTYQSTFLSKRLNVEEKLTGRPSPTVQYQNNHGDTLTGIIFVSDMMSYCVTGHSHLTLLSSQVMSGRKIEYKTLLGHEEPLATDSLFDPIWMSHTI